MAQRVIREEFCCSSQAVRKIVDVQQKETVAEDGALGDTRLNRAEVGGSGIHNCLLAIPSGSCWIKRGVAHLIEGFGEVHYKGIRLVAILHVLGDLVHKPQQLSLTAPTFAEAVLIWALNVLIGICFWIPVTV